MLSPATFRPFRQRHVAGDIYPQRNYALNNEQKYPQRHESPLDVEPLNMLEPFADSAINDGVAPCNMPDDGDVTDLSPSTHIPAINTDVLPTYDRIALEEIIPNLDVTLARDNQIYSYINEIDQLHYERRSMLSKIYVMEEEVARLHRGQSSRCHR
ncbi:hypothetical protein Tco_0683876 [Tanacetum coccineum]